MAESPGGPRAGCVLSLQGRTGLGTSWSLFVCALAGEKKSPGGECIDRVLFPERLERLQEAPSALPGRLDVMRLVLGVA